MKSGWQILIGALWHKPVASLDKAAESLRQWFGSPLGQAVLERELPLIRAMREECAALSSTSLCVSAAGQRCVGDVANAALAIKLYPGLRALRIDEDGGATAMVCRLEEIPLPDDSVDFILLHHALEFSENPHDVLREAVRVLAPRGNLLVVGFNPWSLFGMRAALGGMFRLSVPWAHHRLSRARLTDWLHLMSCEPAGTARGFYNLPLQNRRLRSLLGFFEPLAARLGLPGNGFFMIHANKNVFGRTRQRLALSQRPRLVSFPVATPAARALHLVRKDDH